MSDWVARGGRPRAGRGGRTLAALGIGGFVFFLVKGLVWLGVGAAAVIAAW